MLRLRGPAENGITRRAAEAPGVTGTPTPTTLAAKAFMARIDNETYQRIIETRAVLGGWAG